MKINDQDNHLSSIFNRFPTHPTYLPTFDHPLWIGQIDQMMTLSPLDEVTSISTARTVANHLSLVCEAAFLAFIKFAPSHRALLLDGSHCNSTPSGQHTYS